MAKKMTSKQLQKTLAGLEKEELVSIVTDMYSSIPDACDYLNIRLGDGSYKEAVYSEAMKKVIGGFYARSGKAKLALSQAKEAIKKFSAVCSDTADILKLRLTFVESAVDIASRYYNLPSSFFRDTDNMFLSIVNSLNECEDRSLFDAFDARLNKLIADSSAAEGGMQASLQGMYDRIKWNMPGNSEEHAEDQAEAAVEHISSADAGKTLSEEDAELFYKLWLPLLDFVNRKKHVNDLKNIHTAKELDPNKTKQVADVLWDTPSLIDEYIKIKGKKLSDDDRYIISGWKTALPGRYVVERHLKKGSIFISIEDSKVYQVKGIVSDWEEMLWYQPTPAVIYATLIPFRDVIISDGLIAPMNIYIGGNMAKIFKDTYMTAKRREQIISDLHK